MGIGGAIDLNSTEKDWVFTFAGCLINRARERYGINRGRYGRNRPNHRSYLDNLTPPVRSWFELAQQSEELNRELKQCPSDLASRNGFVLVAIDFQQQAALANAWI
jgi:hypothetical protein